MPVSVENWGDTTGLERSYSRRCNDDALLQNLLFTMKSTKPV